MKDKKVAKSRRGTAFAVSVIIFVVVIVLCLLYLKTCTTVLDRFGETEEINTVSDTVQDSSSSPESAPESEDNEPELPQNPIDFSAQMQLNDEIYAWIRIPNTNVDYPILQSRESDLYYLRRNIDKSYYIPGVIFTQSVNKKDFTDPVTVIYGHNMSEDGSMFATLHNFEDETFFKENEFFYIYTPGHILTYRVVSAYKYDNRHIMNSFDFDNEEVLAEYLDYVMNPVTIPMQVREGVTLSTDDKLVVLSTCMANNMYRYLVNGVLVNDERTK